MPPINRYMCNECGLELPIGWGGYMYAVDNPGHRIVCPHPGEFKALNEVTGMRYTEACAEGRCGYAQYCICGDCLKQFPLDLDRDPRACPACSSPKVKSLRESIDNQCPRCKTGFIKEGPLIRWELDQDWEQLPFPSIVKDLTTFAESRNVPESLRSAAAMSERFGTNVLLVVAMTLLRWWEGDYFSRDKDQKDSTEMRSGWTWFKALPDILRATPALAELVIIRGARCCFAEGASPEVRRGIKNYLRKNRIHTVMS